MCRKHLLGEHVECHMFAGALRKKRSISGYIERGLLAPKMLVQRHNELVVEMRRRGYTHNSVLEEVDISYLPDWQQNAGVNLVQSILDLLTRCSVCNEIHRSHLPDNVNQDKFYAGCFKFEKHCDKNKINI